MSGYIDLQNQGYKEIKGNLRNDNDLNTIVDDIVYELVTKNAKLVNDTEKRIVPIDVLEQEVINYIDTNRIVIDDISSREELIKKVKNYLFGFGILQELIDDKDVSDIKVISKDNIRKKVKGKRMNTDIKFPSDKSLMNYCYYLSIKCGGALSELNAIQKLTDTKTHKDFILRINISIPPVCNNSPVISIRKIPKSKLTLKDLIDAKMINEEIYDYILKCIKSRCSIVWCGKGASGKTTFMNACIDYIPEECSILLLQESPELFTSHPDCISHVVKYKTGETDKEYTLKDLTINGFLIDLDYMIIGEIKDEEAIDFFNAIYSGHIGWTSVHASSAKEALKKIVHLMKYSKTDIKEDTLLEMLSSIDVIIFMKDFKAAEIIEVAGYDYDKKEVLFNPVYQYIKGSFKKINRSCEKVEREFENTDF